MTYFSHASWALGFPGLAPWQIDDPSGAVIRTCPFFVCSMVKPALRSALAYLPREPLKDRLLPIGSQT